MSTVNYFYDWDFDDTLNRFTIDANNYSSDILQPLDITSLTIVFNVYKELNFKLPIIYPTSITNLNLKIIFTGNALKLRQDLTSKIKNFIIPSSIKTLELQFEHQSKYYISKKGNDVTTAILSKKNIKNLKRKHQCISNSNNDDEINDHSNTFFIPTTVVELVIPSLAIKESFFIPLSISPSENVK